MYKYQVFANYRAGVPQTPTGTVGPFLMLALHDTEGGAGYSGAMGTLQFLIDRADRNASYHELWAWDVSTRTFTVIRIVPPTSAAHSVNPFPPSKGGSYEPDATVRAALGARVNDPNRVIYAVSIAGSVAQVNTWSTDADFVAACKRRIAELTKELKLPNRKGEHFRINPSTRSDWGRLLTPALDAEVTVDMGVATRPVRQQWDVPDGMAFWTEGPSMGERKFFVGAARLWSNGESLDGNWRRLEYEDSPGQGEELWAWRANMTPVAGTRNPATGFGSPAIGTVEVSTGITQEQLTAAAEAGKQEGIKTGTQAEKSRLRQFLGL